MFTKEDLRIILSDEKYKNKTCDLTTTILKGNFPVVYKCKNCFLNKNAKASSMVQYEILDVKETYLVLKYYSSIDSKHFIFLPFSSIEEIKFY